MEWPSTAADGDAVIVREQTRKGLYFVVYGKCGPQFTCTSYVEAEKQALSYADRARARVWYATVGGLQLVDGVRVAKAKPRA